MSANRDKLSPSTNILVQLVLQVKEGCVGSRREIDVPQDGTGKERPDFRRLKWRISNNRGLYVDECLHLGVLSL